MSPGNLLRTLKLPFNYRLAVARELNGTDLCFDLGCGDGSAALEVKKFGACSELIGLEVSMKAATRAKASKAFFDLIIASATHLPLRVPRGPRSAALLLSIVEHLEKEQGLRLILDLQKSVDKLIIFTPVGFLEQYGQADQGWQRHRSGWCVDHMKALGFKITGFNGLRYTKKEGGKTRGREFGPLLLVMNFLTTPLWRQFSRIAFEILCVKETSTLGRVPETS